MRTFASDNFAPVDPRVMAYLDEINQGHMPSYDGDEVTEAARAEFKKVFGNDISVLFVPAGTGANILALKLLLREPYEAVVTTAVSHIYEEETGALAQASGSQIFALPHDNGKLTPETLKADVAMRQALEFHSALPKVVSIANSNEYGLVYTAEETKTIADFCHANNMLLHIDGCRLPNAAAALGVSLADLTVNAGADALSLGGAKNGLMCAESIVLFRQTTTDLLRQQKQSMQLVSKMRYISGQFVPYLRDNIWLENAKAANQAAATLADGLQTKLGRVDFTRPLETNQIFMLMSDEVKAKLRTSHEFYDWNGPGEVRLVTSWDITDEDIQAALDLL